ncbi:glycosyltransferase family 4 protein [Weeksellaceae bacterium KMM 9724]|uniref:glycosyltransferase family 4 protein n=1 Tax=Profundicola chukchiensis TaxID=2961959 RepID=UPI00243CF6C7|nr:glycosyltransferase family 4 protein [Profundicola chukchiensis]MDG4949890.1 glycosyltransferase family 4 protein [Profundicola chukchiensis]
MKKELKPYTFFALNTFEKEGGGTIRMYGMLNSLAGKGHPVTLISNAKDHSKFHSNIRHIPINYIITPEEKRKFQFLLSALPLFVVNWFFKDLLNHLKEVFKNSSLEKVYFFEYLDNSIGYWLKKNKVINSYINDLHGVATLEFDFQRKNKTSLKDKAILNAKYLSAKKLDEKVLKEAEYNIYASNAMFDYYVELYPQLRNQKLVILPYLLPIEASEREINTELVESFKHQYHIQPDNKVILFAGAFKLTGGVLDLIQAFHKISAKHENAILLLVGDGYEFNNCQAYVSQHNLKNKVIFTGRTPYDHLASYQELADVIVCPDKDNVFSQLIIHVKYLDSLLSNKPVINGSFKSVMELNPAKKLSLTFEPSNIADLANELENALIHNQQLKEKYKNNRQEVLSSLTYATWRDEF